MLDTVGEPGHGLNPMSEPPVIVRTEGAVGLLTLNRPQALHALTTQMCGMMADALVAWRGDPQVQAVLIDHAGPRGFCAGGDVRAAAESGRNGGADARAFFRAEYQLNALLQAYEKPVVAIMDGVVMGGGAGLALPAQFRIATERTLFAMPEGAIGLFPDVGAGWWLPRLPGYSGLWLAMTGARLGPADCLLLGLATDFVDSAGVEPLKQALVDAPQRFEERLTELEGDAGEPPIALVREAIDHAFGQPTVEAIVHALEADGSAWAKAQAAALSAASPTTLKLAHRLLREGAHRRSFADEMQIEFRIAWRLAVSHDFIEGVRAVLVDKDRNPRWSPQTLEAVADSDIEALFVPLSPEEEWTARPY